MTSARGSTRIPFRAAPQKYSTHTTIRAKGSSATRRLPGANDSVVLTLHSPISCVCPQTVMADKLALCCVSRTSVIRTNVDGEVALGGMFFMVNGATFGFTGERNERHDAGP